MPQQSGRTETLVNLDLSQLPFTASSILQANYTSFAFQEAAEDFRLLFHLSLSWMLNHSSFSSYVCVKMAVNLVQLKVQSFCWGRQLSNGTGELNAPNPHLDSTAPNAFTSFIPEVLTEPFHICALNGLNK